MGLYNLRGHDIIKGYGNLRINGDNILKKYKNLFTGFTNDYSLKFVMYNNSNRSVYCAFIYSNMINNDMIDDENTKAYSSGAYFKEDEGLYKGYLSSHILNVSSTIGGRVGQLLFNLHLLLSIRSNVTNLTLENMTDDPERAANGIYKLLIVDKRGKPRCDFKNMSLSEQLHESEGSMRYIFKGDSEKTWKHNMINLLNTILKSYNSSDNYNVWEKNNIIKKMLSLKRNVLFPKRITINKTIKK